MDLQELSQRCTRRQSFLLGNDGQFLGKLTFNKYDAESIMNQYGSYGSKYSATSIFNNYSNYGSKYSSLSPFNAYTSTPPVIYLKGDKWGYLTMNKYAGTPSLSPDSLLQWMKKQGIGQYD